jgi:sigma-E factor negative regulatory protein RseA
MMQILSKSIVSTETPLAESISALMDSEESDTDISRICEPQARLTWSTYHVIGDALRNPELALLPSTNFHARLAQSLDAELPIVAAPRRYAPLRVGLSSLAIAAAVATLAWVVQPYLRGDTVPNSALVVADASPNGADDVSLHHYLEAHRQMMGSGAGRYVSVNSRVER